MTKLLTTAQEQLLNQPLQQRIFLQGAAGCGKTTIGVQRALQWLEAGIPADQILVLVPQRSLAMPYNDALRAPDLPPGSLVDILTLGGLGQRMISLFWPMIASQVGFRRDDQPPSFLTLETAQYVMHGIVQPMIAEDRFLAVNLDPNRLLSQILDNLNKAAAIGIRHTEVGDRLGAAWIGDKADQVRLYQAAQDCANQFRQFCYDNNLLDFSLQMEVFTRHLWHSDACRRFLTRQYRYLIYDNVEEDVPAAHDILLEWLPAFEGALLIYDQDAGFRVFLGADPLSGMRLREVCDDDIHLTDSLVPDPVLEEFAAQLTASIAQPQREPLEAYLEGAFEINTDSRFYPQMIEAVAEQAVALVQEGVAPADIVIMPPFLSDSLRFSLERALTAHGLSPYTTRPSRSLADEPVTRCLFTWARLANPAWGASPQPSDVNTALMQSIQGLDWVRADLLRTIVYHSAKEPDQRLTAFHAINADVQERISYQFGERFDYLRNWLLEVLAQAEKPELDVFLSRIFGEVLSQPGFVFHDDFAAAALTSRLIESVRKFRRGVHSLIGQNEARIGAEYILMLERGVIAAQYLQSWEPQPDDTILLAPAHTFLMMNRPARYQFWLDIGNAGWWQRLYQPLTHPIVLSRRWQPGEKWSDINEMVYNTETLSRLANGLIRRCRDKILLYTAEVDQQGYESHGMLILALQNILRRMPRESGEVENV